MFALYLQLGIKLYVPFSLEVNTTQEQQECFIYVLFTMCIKCIINFPNIILEIIGENIFLGHSNEPIWPPNFPLTLYFHTKRLSVSQSVQLLSHVRLFATPWIAAHQASLSITNSQSSPKLLSIESVMPSRHLILYRPLFLLPSIPPSMSLFQWVNSSHEVAKVLEFQLLHHSFQRTPRTDLLQNGLVGSLCMGLSRVFSNTTVQKHQFFGTQLSWQSNSHIYTWPLEKP